MKKSAIKETEQQEPKREKEVKVRMTQAEHYAIGEKAHKAGKQLAVYMRDAALQKEIKAQLTPQQIEAYVAYRKMFTGLSNNLNQLLREVHKEGLMKYAAKIETIVKEIEEKLKQ